MQQSEKQAPDRKQPWVGQPRGSEDDEINIVELLYRLIEKWKIIALASLLGALIAAVYTFCFITPMYTATSKLYVVNTKDSAINLSDLQIGNYLASDYTEVFSNWHVHEMVLQRLGLDYTYSQLAGMVSVKNPKDTEQPNIFEEALLPSGPSSPNKSKNVIMGFMIGLILSCGVIVAQFLMDDRLRSADDIEKYVQLPTLGIMPKQTKSAQPRRTANKTRKEKDAHETGED